MLSRVRVPSGAESRAGPPHSTYTDSHLTQGPALASVSVPAPARCPRPPLLVAEMVGSGRRVTRGFLRWVSRNYHKRHVGANWNHST